MTHTEESLMALFYSAADAIHDSLRDDGGVQIAEGLVAKGRIDALRLAIREVLAERDELTKQSATGVMAAAGAKILALQAECERLRSRITQLEHGYDLLRTTVHRFEVIVNRYKKLQKLVDKPIINGLYPWANSKEMGEAIDAAIAQERT